MFVRWGNTCSTSFCVTNGVKQGGIISPMLFNLYMDDLSLKLKCSGIGGYIGTSSINHLILTSIGNCISRLMQLRIRTHQVIFCAI